MEEKKKKETLGYAFNWLKNNSEGLKGERITVEKLKAMDADGLRKLVEEIDWDKIPEYNVVDFEQDDLNVVKAKLQQVLGLN